MDVGLISRNSEIVSLFSLALIDTNETFHSFTVIDLAYIK